MTMTALITGATAGFGAATARRLAKHGARLVLLGRRAEKLDTVAGQLGEGTEVHTLACDVRDIAAYVEALASLPAPFAEIDVLVNNAGIGLGRELAQDSKLADWQAMVETNITGLIAGTHAVLPGMVARNRGHVVNIGSVIGEFPAPANAVYGATKAFVRQFSLCLRADLLGTAIRVTDVQPGLSGGTEFAAVRARGDMETARKLYEGLTPLSAEDVAEAVEWVVTRPPHVNVNIVQLMPVDQAFGPPALNRR